MVRMKQTGITKWYYYAHEWFTKKQLLKLDECHPTVTYDILSGRLARLISGAHTDTLNTIGKCLATPVRVQGTTVVRKMDTDSSDKTEWLNMMAHLKPGSLAHTIK